MRIAIEIPDELTPCATRIVLERLGEKRAEVHHRGRKNRVLRLRGGVTRLGSFPHLGKDTEIVLS
jgi:hypothetical protein